MTDTPKNTPGSDQDASAAGETLLEEPHIIFTAQRTYLVSYLEFLKQEEL